MIDLQISLSRFVHFRIISDRITKHFHITQMISMLRKPSKNHEILLCNTVTCQRCLILAGMLMKQTLTCLSKTHGRSRTARSVTRGTPLRTVQITSDLQGRREPQVYCRDFPEKGISSSGAVTQGQSVRCCYNDGYWNKRNVENRQFIFFYCSWFV
jgi:hypothetical protein